jgi:Cdc6-like AAA superfamily ATPase
MVKMEGENKIIRNMDVLTEHFIPSRIIHRDGQLKTIRDDLKPIMNRMSPRNIFLHGKPGTGKTCMGRYVVSELKEQVPILSSYVNCWECRSRFKILFEILQSLGKQFSVHRRGQPTDELLDILRNKVKDNYCVIILDEVDQLEDSKILYDLTNIPNVSLLMIANKETALHDAEPRIRSRLISSDRIEFPIYKDSETLDILKDRAEWGLIPGVLKSAQLESIANAVNGDARVAINTLRIVIASKKDKKTEELNPHEKLIVQILNEKGRMDSGNLFKIFNDSNSKQGRDRVVDRTFRKYMDSLVKHSLVTSSGDGRWRTYSIPGKV